jgi:hypothetical protein
MQAWGVLGPDNSGAPLSGTRQGSAKAVCADEPAGVNTVVSSFPLPQNPLPAAGAASHAPVTFCFDGQVEGLPYPSLSSAQQAIFKSSFLRELASLQEWATRANWPLPSSVALQVFVSDEYKIARSLVPAAVGHRGRIEIPAWKAIAGEAAIAHELTHVLFPNGNRLLAEGLAIYLQDKIGGNPSFPNFGRPLHCSTREILREMAPDFLSGQHASLAQIRITNLDKIATPSPLRLRVGKYLYDNTPDGQARVYLLAGSFIRFLIERHGLERFHALYDRTPLVPFERNPGSSERWVDAYGCSLGQLELEWQRMISDAHA